MTETFSQTNWFVRDLAGAVLFQVFEWQAFACRMGAAGTSVPEFFDELEDAKVSGRRMTGIPEIEIAPGVFDSGKR